MLGNWIAGKVQSLALSSQRKEAAEFLETIRALDGGKVGALLATVAHIKNKLLLNKFDLQDPFAQMRANPNSILDIHAIQKQVSKGNPAIGALLNMGFNAWILTLRAANIPALRQSGREIWRELQRGIPHVEISAQSLALAGGLRLDINGYSAIPDGMTPEPLP